MDGIQLNAVTRLMGRKDMLLQSLPTWLAVKELSRILVVDWGCVEDLAEVKAMSDSRVWILHVPGKTRWQQGEPWNIGDRFAEDGWIFNIDCDVKIVDVTFVGKLDLTDESVFHTCDKEGYSLTGSCIVTKRQCQTVNGYAEGLSGYGAEDLDFYARLSKAFRRSRDLITGKAGGPPMFEHIPHGTDRRIENVDLLDAGNMSEIDQLPPFPNSIQDYVDRAFKVARLRNDAHMRGLNVQAQHRPAFDCVVWHAGKQNRCAI